MFCYVLSNENRLYTALEQQYGAVPGIAVRDRIAAIKLKTRQQPERLERKDKTGSRTFSGMPAGIKKDTSFELQTYMTAWGNQSEQPAYGPLFQAALGAPPVFYPGGTVGSGSSGSIFTFASPHSLSVGQAVTFGGELRFVAAIMDEVAVVLNAPFTILPSAGSPVGPTVTYGLATRVGSVSIFDFWSPETNVQRLLCGAAVDKMRISVNGDFHTFEFSGPAKDIIDDCSFYSGQGELSAFPDEPTDSQHDYAIIPGHLGQAWLGNTPDQFLTLTNADVTLDNNVDMRSQEFGYDGVRCVVAGQRSVRVNFDLFEQDDTATRQLYQAARQRSPITVMLQLGQQPGQLFGAYLKSVVPEVPEFDDDDTRLEWHFSECRAQGTSNDELTVAFG